MLETQAELATGAEENDVVLQHLETEVVVLAGFWKKKKARFESE
jgi:hypothetical protein